MSEKGKKYDILNILVEITNRNEKESLKYALCKNVILNKGDEIKINIMKVDEKNE